MILRDEMNSILSQKDQLQYQQINELPGDIDSLIRELDQVRYALRASTQNSGMGQERFDLIVLELTDRLREASKLLGSVKL